MIFIILHFQEKMIRQ